jgi:hypothetical protein
MPVSLLTKSKIRQVIRIGYGANQQWKCYTGSTIDFLTLIADFDRVASNVDTAAPRKIQELALNENFQITGEVYVLTVVADEVPDANQTYWISLDGQTFQMVEHVSRKVCHQGAYARIVLQKR